MKRHRAAEEMGPHSRVRRAAEVFGHLRRRRVLERLFSEGNMQGTVKLFFPEKGYGFIWAETGDSFFHQSQVLGLIAKGDSVEFWLDDEPAHRAPLGRSGKRRR